MPHGQSAGRVLDAALARAGFATEMASGTASLIAEVERIRPHVVFICLGGEDDLFLSHCRELRAATPAPIIACSLRHELAAVVAALEAGADDYFVLPMSGLELVSRVRAVVRRLRRPTAPSGLQDRIVAGDVELRPEEHRAYRNGVQLDLSPTEFRLLTALVRQAGRTASHSRLLAQAWGPGYTDGGATLRIYIRRLRSKLGDDSLIRSTRSVGYRFQPAAAVESPAA